MALPETLMFVLGTLMFVLGTIYGYVRPGKEDRRGLFKKRLKIGIVLALILVGIGILMGLAGGGFLVLRGTAVLIQVIIQAVLFIIGTWMGDWLEGRSGVVRPVP